jgi:hypothetical protein
MGRSQGASLRNVKWLVAAVGLLATGCAGAIGAGAAVVVVGAGVLTFTCYDRVAVTVTDGLTGTKLCDAKVTFLKGKSATVATSCYQAALSSGNYTLRVERRGLVTFEEPVEVSESGQCGQTVQTMYIALDRKDRVQPPQKVVPAPAAPVPAPAPASPAVTAPPAVAAPPAAAPSVSAPPPASSAPVTPSATAPLPAAPPPPPGARPPAPASTAFPDPP